MIFSMGRLVPWQLPSNQVLILSNSGQILLGRQGLSNLEPSHK